MHGEKSCSYLCATFFFILTVCTHGVRGDPATGVRDLFIGPASSALGNSRAAVNTHRDSSVADHQGRAPGFQLGGRWFESISLYNEFFTVLLVGGGIFTRTGVGIGWLAIKGRYKNPPPAVILTSGRTTRWSRFRDAPPSPPFYARTAELGSGGTTGHTLLALTNEVTETTPSHR